MSQQRITSIERFKRLSEELQQEIRRDAIAQLNQEADELVQQMQAAVPANTGNLRRSIRKEQGSRETRVTVKAGGTLTTVQRANYSYDYSRGVEFGTATSAAHPFFWPSWRLRRRRIRSRMKRKITQDIKRRSA